MMRAFGWFCAFVIVGTIFVSVCLATPKEYLTWAAYFTFFIGWLFGRVEAHFE
jgi:hypothetical protein